MSNIDDVIIREVNPFNRINSKPMNFWEEPQKASLNVDSIHQEVINDVQEFLDLVVTDHRSRSVMIVGDPGSGKSHLLGRLKRTLNSQAFFVYILCDWADSNNIWRHILRYTVDSLIQIPDEQKESQLILWLKSLSAFTKRSLKQRIFNDNIWEFLLNDRQKFIKHLKDTYKTARIYNPDIFFGLLHDLTNPELYTLACEWLRGDSLSEESMQSLRVKQCIETEDEAKNILANFGRISKETKPIVLCFDNLDTMPKLSDTFLDIQPFFDVNTTIHGESLKNFLVIISIITNTLNIHQSRIQQADKAGIHKTIKLKAINLEQAEAIWAYLLSDLHQQASKSPESPIFPLSKQLLENSFPGKRTYPRNVINLGMIEYKKYKDDIRNNNQSDTTANNDGAEQRYGDSGSEDKTKQKKDNSEELIKAELQILWEREYKKNQEKIKKINLIGSSDLIRMLQEAVEMLQEQQLKSRLLTGRFASYSLIYQKLPQKNKIGIVWTEDANMNGFFHVMSACQRAIQQNNCHTLYLIRLGSVGQARLVGNQIYQQIFTGTNHIHIKPSLTSVHYLATYHSLVNSALSQELVIQGKVVNLQYLQSLMRSLKILNKCILLQDLGIVDKQQDYQNNEKRKTQDLRPVKDFLLNLVKTQNFMGVPTLIKNAVDQFPSVKENDVQLLIDMLCQEKRVEIINPKAKFQDKLICLIAK
ncbi:ATP-binding protein [Nostoc sp. CMAA1605]|uniref:ATP-binding protein n=1 Tax=Nostoc sp. CMAA1605 TaxID=2055159 RepID=UPI001F414FEA|nr:ATP-binding protein [Nostoc sp. CMAA1605]MCF4967107.1 KAP family P-loop domain-containing protein [Nostoc sp. CMAA1605]